MTALYEVELAGNVPEELCEVRLRFKDPDTFEIHEFNRICSMDNEYVQFKNAGWSFRLATLVSEFAEFLRYGPSVKKISPDDMLKELRSLVHELYGESTISELQYLIMGIK